MKDPKYPNVACALPGHERPEPGYAVCGHVLDGKGAVADVEPASATRMGVIACVLCYEAEELDDGARCVCAHCAATHGWLAKELN